MIDLEDPRTGKIADIISNKTAKRILGILAEREMGVNELSRELGMRINSVLYNVRKLVESGLIEETKEIFWSVKGRRIKRYKVVNKRIVIFPRRLISGVIPTVLISVVVAFAIKLWSSSLISRESVKLTKKAVDIVKEAAGEAASISAQNLPVEKSSEIINILQGPWLWFLGGALFGLFVYLLWNLARKKFSGSNKFEVKGDFK